jgi:HD-like signal output (HDOD) protein
MADDLFKGKRFKPGPAAVVADDDSGENYRKLTTHARVRVSEAEILELVDQVPSLPTVVSGILASVGNNQTSAADLEALIKQDMVIAGRLLKMVNSPFYALNNPIASISQAVAIIGFSSLRSLVLAVGTAPILSSDLAAYGFTNQGLWKNSMATAALAREIAMRSGVSPAEAEEAFIAGLLRDVGMLVIGPLLARHSLKLSKDRSRDCDILTHERESLKFDHCWVGDRISERWRLPKGIAMVISRHHRVPATATPKEIKQLASVRLAERLVYSAHVGVVQHHPFDSRLDGTLIQAAGLAAASFELLVTQVPDIIKIAERVVV